MKRTVTIALSIFFLTAGSILAEGFVFSAVKVTEEEKVSPVQNKEGVGNSTKAVTGQNKPIGLVLSLAEASKHNTESDCWLVIKNKVYNVSSYIGYHPGGANRIISECGNEVTGLFASIHSNFAWDLLKKYDIGNLNSRIDSQDQKISPQSQGKGGTSSVNNKGINPTKDFRGDDDEDDNR